MTGGWRHMTRDGGKPYDERYGEGSMLKNGGDVVEALEQAYGMIWWLAHRTATEKGYQEDVSRRHIQDEIEKARKNYKEGVEIGKNFGISNVAEDMFLWTFSKDTNGRKLRTRKLTEENLDHFTKKFGLLGAEPGDIMVQYFNLSLIVVNEQHFREEILPIIEE